jgi:hypothetical protein
MFTLPLRLLTAGVGVVLASTPVSAQPIERVLYASAVDATTRAPVPDLGPADFRVTEDHVVREILRVTPATTPMPVAVIVDNQEGAQATIADLRRALSAFLREIEGIGPVALISTADRPTILQDYTTDQARLQDAVSRIFAQPDSGATLLDAIVEVSRGLRRRESDRAAMVLVTTELTEFGNQHYSQVLDALEDGGAMMSAVVLLNQAGSINDDPSRNRAVVLDRGVKESGGWREDVLTSMSYGDALMQIGRALKHQYRIVYARPQTLIPPERVAVTAARAGVVASGGPARGQQERK